MGARRARPLRSAEASLRPRVGWCGQRTGGAAHRGGCAKARHWGGERGFGGGRGSVGRGGWKRWRGGPLLPDVPPHPRPRPTTGAAAALMATKLSFRRHGAAPRGARRPRPERPAAFVRLAVATPWRATPALPGASVRAVAGAAVKPPPRPRSRPLDGARLRVGSPTSHRHGMYAYQTSTVKTDCKTSRCVRFPRPGVHRPPPTVLAPLPGPGATGPSSRGPPPTGKKEH